MALYGIDISGWQPDINLRKVPCDFVIIKATGGTGFTSASCIPQFNRARKAHKKLGLYHYAHEKGCEGSAIAEADYFVNSILGFLKYRPMLILDFESDNKTDVGWALAWLNQVFARTGVRPLIYLSISTLAAANWQRIPDANYGLWLAQWPTSALVHGYKTWKPQTAPYWDVLAMWQFAGTGRLPHYNGNLDLDVFYGTKHTWDLYTKDPPHPKPKPAPKPKRRELSHDVQLGTKPRYRNRHSTKNQHISPKRWTTLEIQPGAVSIASNVKLIEVVATARVTHAHAGAEIRFRAIKVDYQAGKKTEIVSRYRDWPTHISGSGGVARYSKTLTCDGDGRRLRLQIWADENVTVTGWGADTVIWD